MANFEAFRWNISSSINFEIGRSEWTLWFTYFVFRIFLTSNQKTDHKQINLCICTYIVGGWAYITAFLNWILGVFYDIFYFFFWWCPKFKIRWFYTHLLCPKIRGRTFLKIFLSRMTLVIEWLQVICTIFTYHCRFYTSVVGFLKGKNIGTWYLHT